LKAIKLFDPENYKITEADIIKRVLAGEKELYEILIRRNNQKLFRVVRSYVKIPSDIEDIMQNTYIKGYQKLYQFKLNSEFSTWLIRIGINESLARLKEKSKTYPFSQATLYELPNSEVQRSDHDDSNPEKKIIRQEVKQLLEDAIDSLPSKYRTTYILREVEEMSTAEVSQCLRLSESNVKVRLHRAKNILKEKLFEASQNKDIFEFGFHQCDRLTDLVMQKIS